MCFLLYMSTDADIPTIAWDEHKRKLNTAELTEYEKGITRHFTKTNIKYIGSDQGCGCGFRYVRLEGAGGGWPSECMIGSKYYTGQPEQPMHQQLHDFLKKYLDAGYDVELYGCWDGEFSEASEGHKNICIADILDKRFFFRERYKYTIAAHVVNKPQP